MTGRISIALAALGLLAAVAAPADDPANSNVRISIRPDREAYAPGDSGRLLIRMVPMEGYHVNGDPPPEFTLTGAPGINLTGPLQFETDAESGTLAHGEPVRQPFAIPAWQDTGTYAVAGSLLYFFCSDEAGWCRMFTDSVAATVTVRRPER